MSQATHLIAYNVPAPADSRSLPCSGVSRRVTAFSSGSSLGEHSLLTRVEFISHRRVSNAASVLCGARPGNNWRNPDLSNPNRNWNEDGYNNDEGPGESDYLDSKNGRLLSSTSSRSWANGAPGQTEMEINEWLRKKVLPKLRERTDGKDVKMAETVKGKDDDDPLVEKIENFLRRDLTSEGSNKIRASNNWRAAFGREATSGTQSKRRRRNRSYSKMKEIIITPEPKATPVFIPASRFQYRFPVFRPASSFRRRSPVPSDKYQPIYKSEDGDNDLGEKQQPELDEESESDEEFVSEQDREPGPISSLDDEYIFSVIAKGERSGEENSLEEGDQQPTTEHEDLGSLKLAELRELAKSCGMKGFAKLKKSELLELLSGN